MRTHEIRTGRSRTVPVLASMLSAVSLTLAQAASAAPPPGKGKPDGGGEGTSCSYPAFSDIPRLRLERKVRKQRYDNFRTAERYAWVRSVIDDPEATVTTLLENGSPGTDWTHEHMVDPLNRSGNAGIDADGNLCEGCTPEGKRYSAWYENSPDFAQAQTETIDGAPVSVLALGGEVAGLPGGVPMLDPTRPGTDPWYDIRPRTTWLKTWERGYDGTAWVVEGALNTVGTHKFKAPLYLETSVNFSRMQTPGFRVSMWLMPATFEGDTFSKTETTEECLALTDNLLTNGCYSDPTPEFRSEAYDRNWKNGYEMDLFEFEPVDVIEIENGDGTTERVVCGNAIEFSALNDYFGNRGRDTEYAVKNHFEGFEEGYCDPLVDYGDLSCDKVYANPVQETNYLINDDVWHKVGFLWTEDEVIWIFNDEIVLEIDDPAKVPHPSVHQYLNVSREMTNGLSTDTIVPNPADTDPNTGGDSYTTYLPAEPGLYGWDGRSNVGGFLANVAEDRALIRYIKVWDLSEFWP